MYNWNKSMFNKIPTSLLANTRYFLEEIQVETISDSLGVDLGSRPSGSKFTTDYTTG